jgi:DNA (cytosine-5)-methyltransferase 1
MTVAHANGGGQIPSPPAVAFSCKDHGADAGTVAPTMRAMPHDGSHANGGGQIAVAQTMTVRRLTPRECERLQAFPDDYTMIPWRKKPADQCPDGPRYKALGNSMAVNCMEWIGERIAAYEAKERKP